MAYEGARPQAGKLEVFIKQWVKMLLFVPRHQADYISKLNLVEKIQDVVVGWLLLAAFNKAL